VPFFFVDHSKITVPTPESWRAYGLPNVTRIQPIAPYSKQSDWSAAQEMIVNKAQQAAQSASPLESSFSTPYPLKLPHSLTAQAVMSSPVISLNAQQTLKDAMKLMVKHSFRHLPIVTEADKIVGIVSERDLLRWMDRHPTSSWDDFYRTPITQIMISPVLTVTVDSDVREVAQLMAHKSVGSLPVIHQDSYLPGAHYIGATLQGMITKSDLYTLLIDAVVVDTRV
jgi:CBS domain-containing protein